VQLGNLLAEIFTPDSTRRTLLQTRTAPSAWSMRESIRAVRMAERPCGCRLTRSFPGGIPAPC
jgi:hypothetical protein